MLIDSCDVGPQVDELARDRAVRHGREFRTVLVAPRADALDAVLKQHLVARHQRQQLAHGEAHGEAHGLLTLCVARSHFCALLQ